MRSKKEECKKGGERAEQEHSQRKGAKGTLTKKRSKIGKGAIYKHHRTMLLYNIIGQCYYITS